MQNKVARIGKVEEKLIVLEELDFSWDKKKVENVIALWNQGLSLLDISKNVDRSSQETFLLLFDLSIKEKIKKRKGALFGSI